MYMYTGLSVNSVLLIFSTKPFVYFRQARPYNKSRNSFHPVSFLHRPDLFTFKDLVGKDSLQNLNHAFDVASNKLGIDKLLDAEGELFALNTLLHFELIV